MNGVSGGINRQDIEGGQTAILEQRVDLPMNPLPSRMDIVNEYEKRDWVKSRSHNGGAGCFRAGSDQTCQDGGMG